MTASPPIISLQNPSGKKHHFVFPDELQEDLRAQGISIAALDDENTSKKVTLHEKRGLEVIFKDNKGNALSLDKVVKKLIAGKDETPEQLASLRGNLVHALLHHYERETVTDNGCLSATLLETFAIDDDKRENPRYFVATITEHVNPESYSGRGCAETFANTAARMGYKSPKNQHGDYVLSELHLRCYFTDPEKGKIKFEHGNQCLCGVCRDVCDGVWTEEAKVWLHPINLPRNENEKPKYLTVEEYENHLSYSHENISIIPAKALLPEKRTAIQNQEAAREALTAFETSLKQITHSNEGFSRQQRLELEKMAISKKMELQEMLLKVPNDQIFTVDVMEIENGQFLETINAAMVAKLKQEIYTHLLAEDATPENWQNALPDEIEIVAGVNPKTGHVAITAGRKGKDHSSTPVSTAILAEKNSNVRGMNEIFYMKFDKAEFLKLTAHPDSEINHQINKSAEIEIENTLPSGNHRERAVKQQIKEKYATERTLIQSHSGQRETQTTRQRWTAIPLNNGTLDADKLKSVIHQSTAERLLGNWQGVKQANDGVAKR